MNKVFYIKEDNVCLKRFILNKFYIIILYKKCRLAVPLTDHSTTITMSLELYFHYIPGKIKMAIQLNFNVINTVQSFIFSRGRQRLLKLLPFVSQIHIIYTHQ